MNTREFLKTPKGKIVLVCCILMPVSWLALLFQFSGDLSTLFPDDARKAELLKEIGKLKKEYQEQQKKLASGEKIRKQYRETLRSAWQFSKDGDPELILRQKIETAAKESELLLSNLGSVRISRVNNELAWAELDISTSGDFEVIVKFLEKIRAMKPEISWRRLVLNQMLRRGNAANRRISSKSDPSARTISSTNTARADEAVTTLFLNGSVRVLFHDGENMP